MPPVTQALLLANVAVYLLMMLFGDRLFVPFALWPPGDGFGLWQVVSYSFLHGGLWHLFVNMLALFLFGSEIERLFGARWFLIYYLVCVVSAAVTQLVVVSVAGGPAYPTVGASGGVFGVLLAFGMYFPRRTIMLVIPPIPLPAWLFVTLYGLLELYFGVTQTQSGVAHFAHLGGMVGGFLMILQRRGKFRR